MEISAMQNSLPHLRIELRIELKQGLFPKLISEGIFEYNTSFTKRKGRFLKKQKIGTFNNLFNSLDYF